MNVRDFVRTGIVACLVVLSGCAANGEERDPRDPFEGFNRGIYRFNEGFDDYVAKPVARGYVAVVHREIRGRVSNFFSNIGDLLIGINNFLQFKIEDGVNDWARFAFNSTFGLLGIHDVASEWGLEKHNEDFGQTFGRWGAPPGPYLILPFLGSSTVRDTAGTALDWTFAPLTEVRPIDLRNTLYGLYLVNTRADLLDASQLLQEAALDRYVFQRDAYLQRRRSLIYDGSPPREKFE
jgi:phospholipid-binding lipoprotein MlaA